MSYVRCTIMGKYKILLYNFDSYFLKAATIPKFNNCKPLHGVPTVAQPQQWHLSRIILFDLTKVL